MPRTSRPKLKTFAEYAAEHNWPGKGEPFVAMPDPIYKAIAEAMRWDRARSLVGERVMVRLWTQGGRHTYPDPTSMERVKGRLVAVRDDDYVVVDTEEFGRLLLRIWEIYSITHRRDD